MATKNPYINTITISQKSALALRDYLTQCKNLSYQNWNIREQMQRIDRQYAREMDLTSEGQKAALALSQGDATKFRNITVPIVMPQVEAAVNYQASVFLTGVPLFGVVAQPNLMGPAKQLETIIDHQAIRGGWIDQFIMFFRDGEKYNFGIVENDWKREKKFGVDTDISSGADNAAKLTPVSWEGNTAKRWDPYNSFWDVRYGIPEVCKRGEFVGNSEMVSRIELKQYLATEPALLRANIKDALESPTPPITVSGDYTLTSYFIPQIKQSALINPQLLGQFNWLAWAGLEPEGKQINYQNIYMKTVLYARIIPSDFQINAPQPNSPQIWKFVFINDQILVYAQPVSILHDTFPVFFGQPKNDGLYYQTKSGAENVTDIQELTSAMMNSVVAARRRAVSDRVLYDPSRVSEAQINNPNPAAKIPVRPTAYGKNIGEAVYAFPFNDNQNQLLIQDVQVLSQWADKITGSNPARQGQFVKGNKTRKEFDSTMANSSGSDQLKSLVYECQVFTPFKESLKSNILEKQTPATLYSRELQAPVQIEPVELRKASLQFKISDGLMPSEKLISGDVLKDTLNTLATSPGLQAEYNLGPMFSYLIKTQGADLTPFEKSPQQRAYESAVQSWQQAIATASETLKVSLKAVDPTQIKELMESFTANLPQQPQPQQFGYDPAANPLSTNTEPTVPILAATTALLQPPKPQQPA